MSYVTTLVKLYDYLDSINDPDLLPLGCSKQNAHITVTVDKDGNFVSAADVWNPKKLEELFTRLNPNRKLRLERERLAREEAAKHPELNDETEQV